MCIARSCLPGAVHYFFWARGAATMLRSDLRNVALPDRVIVSLRPHLSDMALPDVLVCPETGHGSGHVLTPMN